MPCKTEFELDPKASALAMDLTVGNKLKRVINQFPSTLQNRHGVSADSSRTIISNPISLNIKRLREVKTVMLTHCLLFVTWYYSNSNIKLRHFYVLLLCFTHEFSIDVLRV